LNLFTLKKEVGEPGDFDHMADEELTEFIEAQGEVVRELERQLLPHQPRSSARCASPTCMSPCSARPIIPWDTERLRCQLALLGSVLVHREQ
jgi:hypothetical protein